MKACSLFPVSLVTLMALSASAAPLPRRQFRIETDRGSVSGIMIAHEDDETLRGSLVNEFGISAIDFSCCRASGEVRLLNVVSFLDKWYIKKVVRRDLGYCLHLLYGTPGRESDRYETEEIDDTLTVTDRKYRIRYTFSPPLPFSVEDNENCNETD